MIRLSINLLVFCATLALLSSCVKPQTVTCFEKRYPEDMRPIMSTFHVIKDKHWFADSVIMNGVDITQSVLDDVGGSYEVYIDPERRPGYTSSPLEGDSMAYGRFITPKYGVYSFMIGRTKCVLDFLYTYSESSSLGPLNIGDFITWLPNFMYFSTSYYTRSKLGKSSTYSTKFMSVTPTRIKLQLQMPDTTISWILKAQ
jgi:hypothetical protein